MPRELDNAAPTVVVPKSLPDRLAELEILYQTAPVGLCLMDCDLRFVRINERMADINGSPMSEHIGRRIEDVIPEIAEFLIPTYRQVIETGEAVTNLEVHGQTPGTGGEDRYFLASYYPIKSEDGVVRGVSTVVRDITEIKEQEFALRTSEARLRSLVESTRAIPWESDARTWRFTYVGPQAEEILGYSTEEWYEADFWESKIHPEDREYAVRTCQQCSQEGGDYEFVYRMIAADGRVVWLHDMVRVESDETGPVTLRGFMLDVTDQTETRMAFEESARKLRLITDSVPCLIAYVDASERYQFNNAAYERWIGVPPEGIHGRPVDEVLDGLTYSHIQQQIALALKGNEVTLETRVISREGVVRNLQASLVPHAAADGTIAGFYLLGTDITRLKRIEDRLRASTDALERNQERLQQLAGKLIAAQEAERRRVARELHDDFSQRLFTLSMDIELLQQRSDIPSEEVREELHSLQEKIAVFSKDLHDLSRRLHPSVLDELGLVRALESECRRFANYGGLRVHLTCDGVDDTLRKDVSLSVYRIAQEALQNIARHARTEEADVQVRVRDGHICIRVADRGVGFDMSARRGAGGLGLASMEERAKLCGGTFHLDSRRGAGTIVEAEIPLGES